MAFPVPRRRRLRRNEQMRSLVRETRLTPQSFVLPLFVCPGEAVRKPVVSMPGVSNLSIDELVKEAQTAQSLGIPAVILFGLPEKKDTSASGAWSEVAAPAIRRALDEAGYQTTPILSKAANFASVFYGPFREAADSAPQFGDRRSYQMDGANLREALREITTDLEEGADMIMVK